MKNRQQKSKSKLISAIQAGPVVSNIRQHITSATTLELQQALQKAIWLHARYSERQDYAYGPILAEIDEELAKR
jgi:hypothetical protein